MRRIALAALALALAPIVSCGDGPKSSPRTRAEFLVGLDLHGNRAFAMAFTSGGELVVSGTAHNKKPAIGRWDGSRWNEMDVPEQVWLERLPSGEMIGIGTTKLYSFGANAREVKEIGVITPNPRTAFNQSTSRVAGDGSIWFVLDTGRFQRIAAGSTEATSIPVPAGTDAETALPGAYARTGDGRMFAGVRGAGIFEVSAGGAEMIVPCSDPEIDDCNGGDIFVVDSYGKEPLFRRGITNAKVYRLNLTTRRLGLVADLAQLTGRLLTSVADAPNGDIYLAVQRSQIATDGSQVLRVSAGADPSQLDEVAEDFVVGPAALAVRKDGRVFSNGGFVIQEIR